MADESLITSDCPAPRDGVRTYVFDIDGTLADATRRQAAKAAGGWKVFYDDMENDPEIPEMCALFRALAGLGHRIYCCSGRPDDHRALTEEWLRLRFLNAEHVFMRTAGDFRPDAVIKVELLRQMPHRPMLWFDDRTRVVAAIRAEGIRVCQVAPGDF